MNEGIVFLQNVSFSYSKKMQVLQQINLTINRGEIIGILGHNGAGKTTLLRLLGKLINPAKGKISWAMAETEKLAYLPEGLGLYPKISGYDNLKLRILLNNKNADADTINSILDNIGLKERAQEPIGNWSTGMKRRLALACALVETPNLLLLDEPFSGIDPLSQKTMVKKVNETIHELKSIVFSSHDLHLVKELCTRIIIIDNGQIVFSTNNHDQIQAIESVYFQYTGSNK